MTVAERAKFVPRTRLKKPTSLKSPTARRSNTKPSAKVNQVRMLGDTGTARTPAVAATRPAHANNAPAITNVAKAEGVNAGRPFTSGTTASHVMRPPHSQYACASARTTNTVTIAMARRLFIMPNVHNEGRAPLLRASLSIVWLDSTLNARNLG